MREPLAFEAGKTISSQVYALLRREIIENRLTPHTRLSEARLCEHYNVSRQPIREVLLRLSTDKLVQVHPQRGSFVSPVSLSLFHASQLIREAVEVEVVSRVATTASRELLEEIRQELALQETFLAHGNTARFYESDERFHRLIASGSGIPALWEALLDHKIHLDRVRYMSLTEGQNLSELMPAHQAIYRAMANRDPAAAREAMQAHLRRVLRFAGSLAERHPDWFAE